MLVAYSPNELDGAFAQLDGLKLGFRDHQLLWDYADTATPITALYEIAKCKPWNVTKDLRWDLHRPYDIYPTKEQTNPLRGFAEYERLPAIVRRRIAWWRHSLELSEILHGEQGALVVASQLVCCLPTVEGKLFASSQVFDEARHVEFFARYLREIAGDIFPPSPELRSLLQATVQDTSWETKLLSCQILIESLAMARFKELRRCTKVPMLRNALEYISKDEARHVRFGTTLLKQHFAKMTSSAREDRAEFILDSMLMLTNSINIEVRIAEQLGWDCAALRRHLRSQRLKDPSISHGRLHILARNLNTIGLFTSRVRGRMSELGLDR
jgi:para-aminobenzoate N-oxygenase AurF